MPAGSGLIILDYSITGLSYRVQFMRKCEACGFVERSVRQWGNVNRNGQTFLGSFQCPKCHSRSEVTLWG